MMAAFAIPNGKLSELQGRVLRAFVRAGDDGLTDDELACEIDVYRYTAAPRRRYLMLAGLLVESEKRRQGPRGRSQIVWKIKPGAQWKPPFGKNRKPYVRENLAARYSRALKAIDRLHIPVKRQVETFVLDPEADAKTQEDWYCETCDQVWPCETQEILKQARSR